MQPAKGGSDGRVVEAPDNQVRLYLAPLRGAHVEGRRSNELETDGTGQAASILGEGGGKGTRWGRGTKVMLHSSCNAVGHGEV